MSSRRQLMENMSSLFLLQAAQYALPLIMLPYLVRVLGPEKYGLIVFAQALAQYFILFTDYGFELTATREIAINRGNLQKVSQVFSTVMAIKLGLLLVSLLFLAAVVFTVPRFHVDWPVYFLAFLWVVGHVIFPTWFFLGMEKMKYITIRMVAARTLALLALFAFVHSESDYLLAVGIQTGGYLLAGMLGLPAIRKVAPVSIIIPSRKQMTATLHDGWQVFVSRASTTLFGNSLIFILGLFYGNTMVGYYAIAEKTVRAAINLSYPASTAIYPRVNTLFAEGRTAALSFLRKTLLFGGLAFASVSVALFLGADIAVFLITGEFNGYISMLMRIMAILPLSIFLGNIYGTQILLSLGMKKQFMRAILYAGLFSLIVSLILVPPFGAVGAAVAFLSAELLVLVLLAVPVHRMGIKIDLSGS
jgi:polysaccharide transporter, PST family